MMKKSKLGKFLATVCVMLASVLVFSLAACNNTDDSSGKLTLDKTTETVEVESTKTIQVTSATTETIEWSVSLPTVATVAGSGVGNKLCTVTGVAAGVAVVTAKAGDLTATCTVTVTPKQSGSEAGGSTTETVTIKLGTEEVGTATQYLYGAGDELTFTATASKGSAITWESSATSIATVANGKVTAVAAGDATITAKVSDTVKASVKVTVLEGTNVEYGGESAFTTGWRYWNSGASVDSCISYGSEGVSITYTAGEDAPWYGVQLFYKDKLGNKDHGVSFTIVSPIEGDITVNNNVKHLEVGENTISVESYICTADNAGYAATITMQFGTTASGFLSDEESESLTFLIKNIVVTSNADAELKVPDFDYDTATKVITINDTVNNAISDKTYQLGLFANATDLNPAYTLTVVSGQAVDLASVVTGDYVGRLKVVSSSDTIVNSDWSEKTVAIDWSNDNIPLSTASATDTWYYWTDPWTSIGAENGDAYVDSDGIHLEVTGNASWTYSVQLKYDSSKTITHVKMTVRASTLKSTGGAVGLNLTTTNYELTQVEGEDYYEVTIDVDCNGTALILCLGANEGKTEAEQTDITKNLTGSILIYDIEFTYAD